LHLLSAITHSRTSHQVIYGLVYFEYINTYLHTYIW